MTTPIYKSEFITIVQIKDKLYITTYDNVYTIPAEEKKYILKALSYYQKPQEIESFLEAIERIYN